MIGRDDEIRRAIQILSRRTKNNPVLIGDPGVGTLIDLYYLTVDDVCYAVLMCFVYSLFFVYCKIVDSFHLH